MYVISGNKVCIYGKKTKEESKLFLSNRVTYCKFFLPHNWFLNCPSTMKRSLIYVEFKLFVGIVQVLEV